MQFVSHHSFSSAEDAKKQQDYFNQHFQLKRSKEVIINQYILQQLGDVEKFQASVKKVQEINQVVCKLKCVFFRDIIEIISQKIQKQNQEILIQSKLQVQSKNDQSIVTQHDSNDTEEQISEQHKQNLQKLGYYSQRQITVTKPKQFTQKQFTKYKSCADIVTQSDSKNITMKEKHSIKQYNKIDINNQEELFKSPLISSEKYPQGIIQWPNTPQKLSNGNQIHILENLRDKISSGISEKNHHISSIKDSKHMLGKQQTFSDMIGMSCETPQNEVKENDRNSGIFNRIERTNLSRITNRFSNSPMRQRNNSISTPKNFNNHNLIRNNNTSQNFNNSYMSNNFSLISQNNNNMKQVISSGFQQTNQNNKIFTDLDLSKNNQSYMEFLDNVAPYSAISQNNIEKMAEKRCYNGWPSEQNMGINI